MIKAFIKIGIQYMLAFSGSVQCSECLGLVQKMTVYSDT